MGDSLAETVAEESDLDSFGEAFSATGEFLPEGEGESSLTVSVETCGEC